MGAVFGRRVGGRDLCGSAENRKSFHDVFLKKIGKTHSR
jgi:hypothetical protein